jgi:peptidoglycan/LPS O-acetylase OafA/YrhL
VVILAAFIQKAGYGDNSIAHIPHNLPAIFCTIVLYTSPLSNIATVNWVYWSLSCEIAFYILIYIGSHLRRKHLIHFFIIISFASLWINAPSGKIYFFFNHWSTFSLGLCIYYLHSNKIKVNKKLLLILFSLNILGLLTHFLTNQPLEIVAAIMTALVIYFSNIISLKNNFLSKLGDFSYAVYLIHVPIGVYLLGYFKSKLFQQNQLLNIFFDITIYCIVTFFAMLIYKYIEQPFIRIGKSLVKKV